MWSGGPDAEDMHRNRAWAVRLSDRGEFSRRSNHSSYPPGVANALWVRAEFPTAMETGGMLGRNRRPPLEEKPTTHPVIWTAQRNDKERLQRDPSMVLFIAV